VAPTLWLQGLHRRYKFAILLTAAWAPVIFSRRPFMAAEFLVIATRSLSSRRCQRHNPP